MLYDIQQPPAATASVILLHLSDNVAIARTSLPAGHPVEINGVHLVTKAPIPAGHKLAVRAIEPGEAVHRYGNVIGFATQPIAAGDHVHVHNLGYKELDISEVLPNQLAARSNAHVERRTFLGYRRPDGRVG